MRDTLKQRLFDLGYGTGSKTPLEAITYIEELELELYEMNVLYGAVKDGLEEKLAKAMEALREVTQTLVWKHFGSCRGYSENLLTPNEAENLAKTVLDELEEKE